MTELQKVLEHLIQTFYHSRVCFFPNILPRCRLFIVLVASMTFILLPMSLVFQMQVQFIHLFISFFEHLYTRVSFLLIYTLRQFQELDRSQYIQGNLGSSILILLIVPTPFLSWSIFPFADLIWRPLGTLALPHFIGMSSPLQGGESQDPWVSHPCKPMAVGSVGGGHAWQSWPLAPVFG